MNEMLIETSKSGTAQKLSAFPYNIASKTGTCGTAEGNTDAYAISYTKDHSIGVWLGDKDNKKLKITSGGNCCEIVKEILENLYPSDKPEKLDVITGTSKVNIDADEYYSNNKILLSDDISPKLNILSVKVLKGNEPTEKSNKFSSPSIKTPQISVDNNNVCIVLCHTKYYSYLVKRYHGDKFDIIYDGNWKEKISDNPTEGYYTYSVTPYYLNGENKIYGKEISLPSLSINNSSSPPQVKIPDIVDKDWFDL